MYDQDSYNGNYFITTIYQIFSLNGTVHRKRSFLSTQPYMTLRFETDNSGADTGFSARYLTASHGNDQCFCNRITFKLYLYI
jgi:hypothetical protein